MKICFILGNQLCLEGNSKTPFWISKFEVFVMLKDGIFNIQNIFEETKDVHY